MRKHHVCDWNACCQAKRVQNGRGAFSAASLRFSEALRSLGIDFEGAGAGGICTRCSIGAPCRLSYPWFVAIRDAEGLSWHFEKQNRMRIDELVQILVKLLVRCRVSRQPALPFENLFAQLNGEGLSAITDDLVTL